MSSIKDLIVRFAYVSKNDSWTISPCFWASSTTFACKESFTEFPNMKMTFTSSISSWSFAHVSRIVFLWSTLPTAEQTTISNNTSSFNESDFWVHISLGSILVVLWSGWTSLWTLLVWLMGQTNATAEIIQLWKFSNHMISIYHLDKNRYELISDICYYLRSLASIFKYVVEITIMSKIPTAAMVSRWWWRLITGIMTIFWWLKWLIWHLLPSYLINVFSLLKHIAISCVYYIESISLSDAALHWISITTNFFRHLTQIWRFDWRQIDERL